AASGAAAAAGASAASTMSQPATESPCTIHSNLRPRLKLVASYRMVPRRSRLPPRPRARLSALAAGRPGAREAGRAISRFVPRLREPPRNALSRRLLPRERRRHERDHRRHRGGGLPAPPTPAALLRRLRRDRVRSNRGLLAWLPGPSVDCARGRGR